MSFDFIVLCLSNSNHPDNKTMNLDNMSQHLPQIGTENQNENMNIFSAGLLGVGGCLLYSNAKSRSKK